MHDLRVLNAEIGGAGSELVLKVHAVDNYQYQLHSPLLWFQKLLKFLQLLESEDELGGGEGSLKSAYFPDPNQR